ncbi:DNA polymerase/3'-5' exonuclease PolX [Longimicrobium sp.]|uniref:DNA polymerase/3'-5' exonuclease PolX n=1 Tax=Longimicrobium sp. TaxID=2029185 RepID=UPI002E310FBD|nr:DNA polymerase/3'-5' exonuclease PolX [Longimicrobium sp.]HEX6038857.1 DNA polymerase/3'-5' exonuclease PolX [Longimicrobium sp.]
MTAREAAALLAEIAMLLEVVGGNPFRAKAFQSASRSLETSGADLSALAAAGELRTLPGVGEGIAAVLTELVTTGTSRMLEELRAQTPVGLFDVMRIKGVGAKRGRTLYKDLGIDSLEKLEEAAAAGRLAKLPGFGAKTEQKILEGVAFVRSMRGRRRFFQAIEPAAALLELVEGLPGVIEVSAAGQVRRRLEVVDSIDLVASSKKPEAVLAAFRALQGVAPADDDDADRRADVELADGLCATLVCVKPAEYATALLFATGSGEHWAQLSARAEEKKLRLARDGVWQGRKRLALPDEDAVYEALGLAFIPPELREGWGEIEAAAGGNLPKLVDTSDLRGTFHCHTTYSDGRASVAEMADAARERGWAYLGIADHSQSAGYAGGLPPAAVKKQHREIDAWNAEHGGRGKKRFRLFKGVESDILADGSLDYPDDVLRSFDYVVGSVHSNFALDEKEQTRRLIRAVSNPHITMLGHATGRLLLRRNGYAVDVRAVIDAAAEHGVCVEINADPHRLDVDWKAARYAAEKGVLVPINPDAHSTGALGNVAWGINVARKAWLTAPQVLNTWDLDKLENYLAERKQKSAP